MKVRFGMLMTDAVGKAGGQFIQRTRFGNVLRNITIPVQRLASLQNPQRVVSGFVYSRWDTLSVLERQEWAIVGNNLRTKNVFGEDVSLTPRQAFCKCGSIRYAYNGELASPYSFNYNIPAFEIRSVEIDPSGGEINVIIDSQADVSFWQVKARVLKSSSINLSPDKLITFARIVDITENNYLYDLFFDKFGEVIPDTWVMVAIRAVNNSSLVSDWQIFKVQVL